MNVLTVLKSQWDRAAALACLAAGVIALIVGYHGVAHTKYVPDALAYLISGGLGGVFLLGVGALLYSSADMHDEWRKLDRIEAAILRLSPEQLGSPSDADGVESVRTTARSAATSNGHRTTPVKVGLAQRVTGGDAAVLAMKMPGAALAVALLCGFLAWYHAAHASAQRAAYTSTAWATLVVVLAVGAVAMQAGIGKRRLQFRRRALLRRFETREPVAVAAVRRTDGRLLVINGGRFAHAAHCAMLHGEAVSEVDPVALPAGVERCAICAEQ
ncbi:MAG TPA: hypothetical protein VGJ14_10980 [Sporichthyaceae bacterium]